MADARLAALLLVWGGAVGCGSARPAHEAAARASSPRATQFPDDPHVARYHSRRLSLWLPLTADGWRIDDHSRPELVATHAATASRVVIAVMHTDALVGRSQCESLAAEAQLLPKAPLQDVDDEVATGSDSFDTRVRVVIEAPTRGGAPLVGHVLAAGGAMHKCFFFDYATEVARADDEGVLSSRLAFARTRILGGLQIETLGAWANAVPRSPP